VGSFGLGVEGVAPVASVSASKRLLEHEDFREWIRRR